MAAPVIVGTPTTFASATSGSTIVLDVPTVGVTLQDGDVVGAALRTMGSTSPSDFTCAGFTRRGYAFVPNDGAGRVTGLYLHPVTNAASEPGSFTFSKTVADARRVGAMFIIRGVDLSNMIAGNSVGWDATPTPRIQLNSFAVDTSSAALLLYAWGNEVTSPNATAPTIIPGTEIALVPSSSGTGATRSVVWVGWESISATSTGNKNLTWTNVNGPAATGVVLRGLNVVTTSGTVTAAAAISGTVVVEVARAASVTAVGAVTGSVTSEVSRGATVAAAASLTGTVGAVSITRTAVLAAGASLAGAAVVEVAVAAVITVAVSVSSVAVLQVERSAVVAVAVSVSGAVKGPPIPDVRVLDEVAFVHPLTGIPVSHTLEDA